jgi:hypothetical protein
MEAVLSTDQVNVIRESIARGNFSTERHVRMLVEKGFSKEIAEQLVAGEVKAYREELFQEKITVQDDQEVQKITDLAAIMVALAGPVFEVRSVLWYLVAAVLAGSAGYFGHRSKPVAGITGAVLLVLLFPFTYSFYFSGRSSYLRIELIIPMLMALVPAYVAFFIISKVCYSKYE